MQPSIDLPAVTPKLLRHESHVAVALLQQGGEDLLQDFICLWRGLLARAPRWIRRKLAFACVERRKFLQPIPSPGETDCPICPNMGQRVSVAMREETRSWP